MPGLRAGNTAYDGLEEIPTFDHVVALARRESLRLGRPIGVIPEIKTRRTSAGSDCHWRNC